MVAKEVLRMFVSGMSAALKQWRNPPAIVSVKEQWSILGRAGVDCVFNKVKGVEGFEGEIEQGMRNFIFQTGTAMYEFVLNDQTNEVEVTVERVEDRTPVLHRASMTCPHINRLLLEETEEKKPPEPSWTEKLRIEIESLKRKKYKTSSMIKKIAEKQRELKRLEKEDAIVEEETIKNLFATYGKGEGSGSGSGRRREQVEER